ncbi:MAG: hypothetical protein ABI707_13425, partial [Ferruginibacter sp.]
AATGTLINFKLQPSHIFLKQNIRESSTNLIYHQSQADAVPVVALDLLVLFDVGTSGRLRQWSPVRKTPFI